MLLPKQHARSAPVLLAQQPHRRIGRKGAKNQGFRVARVLQNRTPNPTTNPGASPVSPRTTTALTGALVLALTSPAAHGQSNRQLKKEIDELRKQVQALTELT